MATTKASRKEYAKYDILAAYDAFVDRVKRYDEAIFLGQDRYLDLPELRESLKNWRPHD